MRRAIQLYCVLYGCLGTILAFIWFLSALFGKFIGAASSLTVVLTVFLVYGLAACLTFQRYSERWEPFVTLTANRIRLGKAVFAVGTLIFFACFAVFIWAAQTNRQILTDRMVYLVLTSLVLQNAIYIAVHWLIRPEHIFPKWFMNLVTNPLGFFLNS